MKRFALLTMLGLLCALAAASGKKDSAAVPPPGQTELLVAAAASLKDAFAEAVQAYQALRPEIKVITTYGASGALQSQIEQGAPIDLFISAAPKQMDTLQTQGLILSASRLNLLSNEIVLITPAANPAITAFADVATAAVRQIALGEISSVPAGQYAAQVFIKLGILEAVTAKAVYAKDVRQVLAYVASGEVEAGVVYATDAAGESAVFVAAKAPPLSHAPVVYPAAVVSSSAEAEAAGQFLLWLSGAQAQAIFARYGFTAGD